MVGIVVVLVGLAGGTIGAIQAVQGIIKAIHDENQPASNTTTPDDGFGFGPM